MQRSDITTEVMVALAANNIRPPVAEEMKRLIAEDEDLRAEAMVADMGADGTLDFLSTSHAAWQARQRDVGTAEPTPAPTGNERGQRGRVIPLWPVLAALAACIVLGLFWILRPDDRDTDVLASILNEAPNGRFTRSTETPDWYNAVEKRDFSHALSLLRAKGAALDPREQVFMGYCFLRTEPAQLDSARYYFELAGNSNGQFREDGLVYAGAAALQAGDTARSKELLNACVEDQRATDLLRSLEKP
jgi:hypothetical protein